MGRIIKEIIRRRTKIDRSPPLGFVIIGPEHLKFKLETQITTKKKEKKRTLYHRTHSRSSQKEKRNFAVL